MFHSLSVVVVGLVCAHLQHAVCKMNGFVGVVVAVVVDVGEGDESILMLHTNVTAKPVTHKTPHQQHIRT